MDYSGGDDKAGNFNQAPERADDFIIKQGEHNPSALGKEVMAAGKAPGDYSETSDSTAENEGTMSLSMPPGSEINEKRDENQGNNNEIDSTTPKSDTEAAKQAMEKVVGLNDDSGGFYGDIVRLRNTGEKSEGEK